MNKKRTRRILSWVLCFAMVFGMLPGALAWSETDTRTDAVEIAFFQVDPEKADEAATLKGNAGRTDYEITYSDPALKNSKSETGAGYDNGLAFS